jgi:hypothetical protein
MLFGSWISKISHRQVTCLAEKNDPADLVVLRDLLADGKIVSLIGQRYGLADVPAAIRCLEQRQGQGKIVINVVPEVWCLAGSVWSGGAIAFLVGRSGQMAIAV